MAEEGKYDRARTKSGIEEMPFEEEPLLDTDAPVAEPVFVRETLAEPDFERVPSMCDDPHQALVVRQATEIGGNAREAASQFKAIRSRILAMNGGKPPQIIMVTSSTVAEGKTTVALNLAAALSEIDSTDRVVVLDGDLPAPAVHMAIGMKPDALLDDFSEPPRPRKRDEPHRPRGARTGLRDVLTNGLDLSGNVYETEISNLDVIPGRVDPEEREFETELNENCAALLDKLRRYYSFIIVDTPPLQAASQAGIFAKHCDLVLVVARLEGTPREVVKKTVEQLQQVGAKQIACVLNHHKHHVPSFIYRFFGTPPGYYYGYGYGYRYGYGYGYGKHRRRRTRK